MSLIKGLALVAAGLALQGAPLSAEALYADCGTEGAADRLIGLDRSSADVCADRFQLAPLPPVIPLPARSTAASNERPARDAPADAAGRGVCMRFVPGLALTIAAPCEPGNVAE
ncbi:MAG: hypothetical protein ACOYLQ_17340 [Hyphomicrobiaceae bacterium]|jgi:hypothetical protein